MTEWVWSVFELDVKRGYITEEEAQKRMAYARETELLQSEYDRQHSDQTYYPTNIYKTESYKNFRARWA